MNNDILSKYNQFLRDKIKLAQAKGFDVPLSSINPDLKPHTRDIVRWALAGGQRAVFASFGLHKTSTNLEIMRQIGIHRPGLRLIVLPLGVRQEFAREVEQRFTGDCALQLQFIRTDAEAIDPSVVYMTNYESVREGKIDPRRFRAVSLDEASVLRSYGSKTYQEFLPLFEAVEFKFVFTATPSPNRFKELIHYAGFLGVMDTGQALTRFFQRDSEKAGNLTLYPHKTQEFWLWVASWAVFIQKPSDLCKCPCHAKKSSSAVSSEFSPSTSGCQAHSAMAPGAAGANVEVNGSPRPIICSPEASLVADASGQSTEERVHQLMQRGAACSTELDATASTTRSEESEFVTGGGDSPISSPTLVRHQPVAPLSESTTTAATSQETASGPLGKNRPETLGATCESHMTGASKPSQHGQKSSGSNTGLSIPDTRLVGHLSGCSENSCAVCAQLDAGYVLPAIEVRYHEVPSNYEAAGNEKNGQGLLIPNVAMGLSAAACEKRDSMAARVAKVAEIIAADPGDHFIIWHDLEDERHAIQAAVPEAVSVWGTQDLEPREQRIADFSDGKFKYLSTKPIIAGSGCNFQRHCHRAIFAGIGFKFNDFIQAIHRIQRFEQNAPVIIDIIHTEVERAVLAELRAKWDRHEEMQAKMGEIIRSYGLDQLSMQDSLARTIGVERQVVKGDLFTVANNDCVLEASLQPDNSVGLIVTSIPFANHYEYSPSYNDFGHTQDNSHFWQQMDFLTPQLLRILQPGRIYACHVKDRINFGNVTGAGVPTVSPFHAEALFHGLKHGFDYMGMITVVTDVVRENNQTYRLGYSEVCKDGTKMGVGSPEYILLFHKPQTDRSRGYADDPVTKAKPLCQADDGTPVAFDRKLPPIPGTGYSVARWQVDAHAFWRSSGDRLISASELASLGPAKLAKAFTELSLSNVYNYEYHVAVGETLLANKALPADYMSLAPGSTDPMVWHDIVRMRTLNGEQSARAVEKHVCLARGSLVLTRRGFVPIERVVVGDETLTHRGRWRKVLVVANTGVRPVVDLRAQGVGSLTLTPEHKVWARKSNWVRARDGAIRATPSWIAAEESVGGYVNLQLPPVEDVLLDETECWLVGRWLADGHVGTRGDFHVSVGPDKLVDFMRQAGSRAGTSRVGTAVQIRLKGLTDSMKMMLQLCGSGAEGKQVPVELLALPPDKARSVLAGYLSGDGHFLRERNRWVASSVSRALLLGLAMLAQRVHGTVASIYAGRAARKTTIQGREVNVRAEWILAFDIPGARRKKHLILDDGAWKQVRSVAAVGDAETWCIKVDEDESFTAEGCIVANCPFQIDIVDRLINRYSNPGDLVYDPFAGLGTVPVRAMKLGRRGAGSELNPGYFADQVHYCRVMERELSIPTLFDLAALDAQQKEDVEC